MRKLIKVQGKWYILLAMYGGKCYLSKLFDIWNEVEKEGVIWEMQPFFYQHEFWYGKYFQKIVFFIRKIKEWGFNKPRKWR